MGKGKSSWGVGNFIAIIILAGLLIVGGSLLGRYVSNNQAQDIAGAEVEFQPVVEKTISYEGINGKNALELLKASHQVETQDSSIGIFVTGIDNVQNQDNKYWMFYVDDKLAALGADQYQTKDGEKIEWRYESLQ